MSETNLDDDLLFNETNETNNADDLVFAEEGKVEPQSDESRTWKLLIVDDEKEVHQVTRLVLEDFNFEGRKIEFLNAYSGKDAIEIMEKNHDIALVLLDVVMETNDAGLEVTHYIREKLKNSLVRIILRTGQPGQAPEREVIIKYDINDYKLKSMLTDQGLFTTIIAAIRGYRDLKLIERHRMGLEQILEASAAIFKIQSLKQFASGALDHLTNLISLDNQNVYSHASGFTASFENNAMTIIAGIGKFKDFVEKPVKDVISDDIIELLNKARESKQSFHSDNYYVGYFVSQHGAENVLYIGDYHLPMTESDKNMIRIFSSNLSIALDNIYLSREVVNTQKEVVYTLGEVVETRSKETANHVRRVAEYSYLFAKKIRLDEDSAEILRLASPMHDVGKIGIPDMILNKPGRLTPEEFEVIKTHTVIGYEILKHSHRDIMKAAAIIALQHHERWNGEGYPQKVKGENIHIYGRITALADVFDALSYKRVYKEAWELTQILTLIEKERGEHFDPTLVDIFLRDLQEFLDIKRKYPDDEHLH